MVLGLLAVIWIAVLAPPLLRRGAESRKSNSVGDFHRHLGVLQRTGPVVIAPAHTRVDRAPVAYAGGGFDPPPPRVVRSLRAVAAAETRRRMLRRRRNVLVGLGVVTFTLVAVGAVPGLHLIWAVAAVAAVLLGAYMALLVRLRNLAAEREMKLRFLPAPPPVSAYERTALLSQSAGR